MLPRLKKPQRKQQKNLTKVNERVILEQKLKKETVSRRNKDKKLRELRKKEKDYKAFVQKLGAKELSDLDADEIKVKLDQILDWNDNSNKKYVEVDNVRRNNRKKT